MIWKMSFMKKRILKKLVSENFVSAKARVSSDYVAAKFSLLTDIEAKFYNFEGIFLHILLALLVYFFIMVINITIAIIMLLYLGIVAWNQGALLRSSPRVSICRIRELWFLME